MGDALGCRLRGFVVGMDAPYGDVGAVEIVADRHPYLVCSLCGTPVWLGQTGEGATVLVCHTCKRILDARRVA
jgi:hypothetical protein